jgi:hypothetical protein
MNHTLQSALTWFGAISALGYIVVGIWLTAFSVTESRRLEAKRSALRAQRRPLTEAEIEAVDIDAELANVTKENGR